MPKLAEKPTSEATPNGADLDTAKKKAPTAKAPAPKLLAKARPLADVDDWLRGLWCGDQGTGKTTDVLSMANLGKVVMVNAEGGAKKKALARMGVNVDNIVTLPDDPAELTHEYLRDLGWELKSDAAKGDGREYVGAVWDSITDIHLRILRNVVGYQFDRATGRGESRISTASPGDMINEFFTDLSDYGVMTSQIVELLKLWHDAPMHFGVTSLLRRDKDDDGKVAYRPAVTPALQGELLGIMDVVIVTDVVEMDDGGDDLFRGLTRPLGKYRGKDRYKILPRRLIDPTFDRVWAYVQEEMDPDTDPVMEAAQARVAVKTATKATKAVEGADDASKGDDEPEEAPEGA